MELQEPKRKKYCHLKTELPLPIRFNKDGSIATVSGIFNGFSVEVGKEDDMRKLVSMGSFGKANFSRSFPQFMGHKPEVLRDRQFKNRKNISQNFKSKPKPEKVIVVPDSDAEEISEEYVNSYFTNLKPLYQIDNSGLRETLWMGLEEAFFLVKEVKCLEISYNSEVLSIGQIWNEFCKNQPNFPQNYVVYYYYRCKNWIVKPGVKFGGDFLLYKQGPAFYHASYVIIIQKINENTDVCDNIFIFGLNRLCETAAKELLIAKVYFPENCKVCHDTLSDVKIQEILLKRWTSSTERNT